MRAIQASNSQITCLNLDFCYLVKFHLSGTELPTESQAAQRRIKYTALGMGRTRLTLKNQHQLHLMISQLTAVLLFWKLTLAHTEADYWHFPAWMGTGFLNLTFFLKLFP